MKYYLKHSSNCSRNPSCSSVFLLMVEYPSYQWASIQLCCIFFLPITHHRYNNTHPYVPWYFVRLHTSQVCRHQHSVPWTMSFGPDALPHTWRSRHLQLSTCYCIVTLLHSPKVTIYSRLILLQTPKSRDVPGSDWVNLISVTLITHIKVLWNSPVCKHWIIGDSLIT